MRAGMKPYPPTSVVGTIIISRLGNPPGRHALHVGSVGLVTGLLDRLPSRVRYKKVIRCDIWNKSRIVMDNVFQAIVVCLLIRFVVSVPYCCVCMYTVSICIYLYVKQIVNFLSRRD